MKTLADQIKDLVATRTAKAVAMQAVAQKSIDDNRSMDSAEAEEFDTLESEVKQIDQDIDRLQRLERLNISKAMTVVAKPGDPNPERTATQLRGAPAIIVNKEADEKFKGQNYTRMVIAKSLARLEGISAVGYAQQRWGKSNPQLVEVIKASVAGGGSGSGEWGAELVQADARYTGDFIAYLTSKTVFDKLGLREVPANITIKGQDGTATGYWVGQSKGIPASAQDYSTVSLTPLKVGAIAVVSKELLRDSSPAAEALVRDALVDASAQRIDTTFLSTSAASSGVSPAGLLNGVSGITTGGADADGLRLDIVSLYQPFLDAKNASGLTFVTTPSLAKSISLMRNALGQKEFPELTAMGGLLEGDPVVTGDNVNSAHLILLKPSDIWKIGDGGIEVSMTDQATVEMANDPAGASDTPVAMANYPVSMFQTESVAIKVVRSMNFAKRRSHAVQYISDAAYSANTT